MHVLVKLYQKMDIILQYTGLHSVCSISCHNTLITSGHGKHNTKMSQQKTKNHLSISADSKT